MRLPDFPGLSEPPAAALQKQSRRQNNGWASPKSPIPSKYGLPFIAADFDHLGLELHEFRIYCLMVGWSEVATILRPSPTWRVAQQERLQASSWGVI
jgi:hypothetical protein